MDISDEPAYEGYFGDIDDAAEPYEDYWERCAREKEEVEEEFEAAEMERELDVV